MTERIDTKAVLDGINATVRGNGKPASETLLVWWKALAQEIADREIAQAHIEEMERLVREARVFIRGEKFLADWVGDAPDWELRADAALAASELHPLVGEEKP